MQEWNVVVSLQPRGYKKAFKELQGFGQVSQTEFFNVLAMKVSNIERFCQNFQEWVSDNPSFLNRIARMIPVTDILIFQTPEEFEKKAQEIVLKWVSELGNKQFHVRMNRRGFKGSLSSLEVEHLLNKSLLDALEKAETQGKITFDDPDAIVVVETLGQWAGFACWKREDLQRYPWLKID